MKGGANAIAVVFAIAVVVALLSGPDSDPMNRPLVSSTFVVSSPTPTPTPLATPTHPSTTALPFDIDDEPTDEDAVDDNGDPIDD